MPCSGVKDKRTGSPYRNRPGAVYLRLPPALAEHLHREAEEEGERVTETIRRVLASYFGLPPAAARGLPPGRPRKSPG